MQGRLNSQNFFIYLLIVDAGIPVIFDITVVVIYLSLFNCLIRISKNTFSFPVHLSLNISLIFWLSTTFPVTISAAVDPTLKLATLSYRHYNLGYIIQDVKIRFYLPSHLAKFCRCGRIYVGVTKTGSGSPFAKMSTF